MLVRSFVLNCLKPLVLLGLLTTWVQAQSLTFEADYIDGLGEVAWLEGEIETRSLADFDHFMAGNPDTRLLIFYDVPGSGDDITNIALSARIRALGLDTYAPGDSFIASGGVDLFLAGVERTIDCGAQLGVHSWQAGDGVEGSELPRTDPEHHLYLDYYRSIGVADAFYWYTLEAASAADIHFMSDAEIAQHGLATTKRAC
ncbi:MAG: hypothetical protein Rhims3KO_04300 [Hyphomicrobiales bacterium]